MIATFHPYTKTEEQCAFKIIQIKPVLKKLFNSAIFLKIQSRFLYILHAENLELLNNLILQKRKDGTAFFNSVNKRQDTFYSQSSEV